MDEHEEIAATLSPWMKKALQALARKGMVCTCTSIGAMLTGRQSAYGWQTSAREGGRTLQALQRRGLACQTHPPPETKIFPWQPTDRGRKVASHLAANSVSPTEIGHAQT